MTTTIKPMHPGELLREDIMPEANLTQGALAEALGVSRLTISELVNEKRALSPDMAHRLGLYFGNAPEFWLNLQRKLDLWEAAKANQKVYRKIKRGVFASVANAKP